MRDALTNMLGGEEQDAPAPDALTLLKTDHDEAKELFKQALDEDAPAAQRRNALTKLLDALDVHMRMEEAIFYPAMRKAGGREGKDEVLEAAEEHDGAKSLIAKIRRVQGRDETLKAKITVLKEMIEHHVEEEEDEMFSEARKVLGKKLDALGAEMQTFKDRAMGRGGRGAKKSSGRKTTARKKAPARKAPARKKTAATGRRKTR